MTTTEESTAKPPYCPWGSFEPILIRLKGRNPTAVDTAVLIKWDVTKSNAQKALPALRFLGVIDSSGQPNAELWQSLTSPDAERYKAAVRDMMNAAYARLLSVYPHAFDSNDNQLAGYVAEIYGTAPQSRKPVVAFIRGLMKEAGVTSDSAPEQQAARPRPKAAPGKKVLKQDTKVQIPEREKSHRDGEPRGHMAFVQKDGQPSKTSIHIHIHVGSTAEKIMDVISALINGLEKEHQNN